MRDAMLKGLTFEIVAASQLTPALRDAVRGLCDRAFGEETARLIAAFPDPTHVLAFEGGELASHALWITRWLRPGPRPALRTAYVEMVATEPARQRRGLATAVMQRLASAISAYELGALCPAGVELYSRLGWTFWRGPLFTRSGDDLILSPDERVMILTLRKTPPLDLDQPLSVEWREGETW
jgi:GNAT superfamily N-acetyltransferase